QAEPAAAAPERDVADGSLRRGMEVEPEPPITVVVQAVGVDRHWPLSVRGCRALPGRADAFRVLPRLFRAHRLTGRRAWSNLLRHSFQRGAALAHLSTHVGHCIGRRGLEIAHERRGALLHLALGALYGL